MTSTLNVLLTLYFTLRFKTYSDRDIEEDIKQQKLIRNWKQNFENTNADSTSYYRRLSLADLVLLKKMYVLFHLLWEKEQAN